MTTESRFEAALAAWGADVRLGDRLGGGNRNDVRLARIGAAHYAARLSPRPPATLEWELDLLAYLRRHGLRVPLPLPSADGRRRVDGLVLFEWLDGDPPSTAWDWLAVHAMLRAVHALTRHWPQRPGFRSTRELLRYERGGDVYLDLMPPEVVRRCRAAWRPLIAEPRSVVHSDPNAGNIRLSSEGVGIFDWDEARVDASILDVITLCDVADWPEAQMAAIAPERMAVARRALDAWEVANGWVVEPSYARRRLTRLDRSC